MHAGRIAIGVDQEATLCFGGRDFAETLAQTLVKGRVESLKAIGSGRADGGAAEPDLDRKVENQCQIGGKTAEREAMQHRQIGKRQTAAVALISER